MIKPLVLMFLVATSCDRSEPHASRSAPTEAPPKRSYDAKRAPYASDSPRLPEDPIAGARSSRQWDAHLAHEERERKLYFDRPRVGAHKVIIAQLLSARAHYDRARTPAALAAAHAAVLRQMEAIKVRIAKVDPWGTSSGLLADYAALEQALTQSYPAAKLAGDAAALTVARASIDHRVREMREWLEEAAKAEGEGEHDELRL